MLKRKFSVEEVAKASKAALHRLKPDLPSEIGERLKLQRVASRHGTEMRMFLYHIWDTAQPTVLAYRDFSYGVVYDPTCRYHSWKRDQGGPCNLLVRFYLNRHKIYDKPDAVVPALWEEMAKAEKILYDFARYENDQVIGLFRFFDSSSIDELEERIYQGFLELIPYWHPKYAAVVDNYGKNLSREDVREVIAGRKKYQPSGPRQAQPAPEYCRHVPLQLRARVFQLDGHRCVYPGCNSNACFMQTILFPFHWEEPPCLKIFKPSAKRITWAKVTENRLIIDASPRAEPTIIYRDPNYSYSRLALRRTPYRLRSS